jgi:transglutaminase-like putative cysteine protease
MRISYKIDGFSYAYITVLFIVAMLIYWFYHGVLKRGLYKFLFTLGIIISCLVVFYFKNGVILNYVNTNIIDNFSVINTKLYNSINTNFLDFKAILTIAVPIIILVCMLLITLGLPNNILVLNLTIILLLWYTGYTEEVKSSLFQYVFLNLITYCLNTYIKNSAKMMKRGIRVMLNSKKVALYMILFCLAIAQFSIIMPQNFGAKYSSNIRSRFHNQFANDKESEEQRGKKLRYDLASSGYDGNRNRLGGPLVLNDLTAFKVKSDKPYYLMGTVKDLYDGSSWEQSEKKYGYKDKHGKIAVSYTDISSNYLMDSGGSLTIYPQELNTSTYFAPEYTADLRPEKGEVFYDDIPTFMNSSMIAKPYTVKFMELSDVGKQKLNDLNLKSKNVGPIYYSEAYKKYLQLPDNISPATYKLVYDITRDSKNDLEKVKRIRDYLSTNYTYSINVSELPEGKEFVDYFLFTEKKGYCTYFASALTVMCRIAGVPARYVEGFNMTERKDDNGLYVVSNENAHAWTEVLFMENQQNGIWYTADAVPNGPAAIREQKKNETKVEETQTSTDEGTLNSKLKRNGRNQNENDNEEAEVQKLSLKVIVLIYFVSIILFITMVRILWVLIRKKRILSSSSIIPLYLFSMRRLKTIGIKKPDYLGDVEFIQNVNGKELRSRLAKVSNLVYGEFYGNKTTTEFNKKEFYNFIEKHLRQRQNIFVYFVKKYFYINLSAVVKLFKFNNKPKDI